MALSAYSTEEDFELKKKLAPILLKVAIAIKPNEERIESLSGKQLSKIQRRKYHRYLDARRAYSDALNKATTLSLKDRRMTKKATQKAIDMLAKNADELLAAQTNFLACLQSLA